MENSKESSITVGTFVVPTVNPSFMVGKAIKSEFGSLAQSSHKSTVKGGDKAENTRIKKHNRSVKIAKWICELNGGIQIPTLDGETIRFPDRSFFPIVQLLTRKASPEQTNEFINAITAESIDKPEEVLQAIKMSLGRKMKTTKKGTTEVPYHNYNDNSVVYQIEGVDLWIKFIIDKWGSYDKWIASIASAKSVKEIVEPFYELVTIGGEEPTNAFQESWTRRSSVWNTQLGQSAQLTSGSKFNYEEFDVSGSIVPAIMESYAGSKPANDVIGYELSAKQTKELAEMRTQADAKELALLESRIATLKKRSSSA